MKNKQADHYSPEDVAKRRDEVIRRMANTPPQPNVNPQSRTKKKAVEGRAVRKDHVGRES